MIWYPLLRLLMPKKKKRLHAIKVEPSAHERGVAKIIASGNETDGSEDDQSDEDLARIDDSVPDRWSRPEGAEVCWYEGWKQWTALRWGWEFLRRNASFQQACEFPYGDRAWIASTFHLKRFKDFRQEYHNGRRAKFESRNRAIPRRADFEQNLRVGGTSVEARVTLSPTEVLIRFEIEPMLHATTSSVHKQSEWAERRLADYAELLRRHRKIDSQEQHQNFQAFPRDRLLSALRLLDWMIASPGQTMEAATLAVGGRASGRPGDWAAQVLNEIALPLVNGGYVTLEQAGIKDARRGA